MRSTWISLFVASAVVAQPCPDEGSQLRPGVWIEGPRLGLEARRGDPAWRLHLPPHRARTRRSGRRIVAAAHRPCTLFEASPTGLVLWPTIGRRRVVVASAVDVSDTDCAG